MEPQHSGTPPALRPSLRIGRPRNAVDQRFQWIYPLRRHWPAIAVVAVMDAAFLAPALLTLRQSLELWQQPESLFDLAAALFTSFWLLGWSIAPIVLTALLVMMLFGREVASASPGRLSVFLGLPLFGLTVDYQAGYIGRLHATGAADNPGRRWRGDHACFDYGGSEMAFGIDIDANEFDWLQGELAKATGRDLTGPPSPVAAPAAASEAPAAPLPTPPPGRLAGLLLVAANLVPLLGAMLWQWDLGQVLLLYWAESAVIGFYNLGKIIAVGRWAALFFGPFFLGHFGGFMAVHFLFLYTLFLQGDPGSSVGLDEVWRGFATIWPALLALFVSHGYSFFANFIGRGEYRTRSVKDQMHAPYSRIIFMHLVIIVGGGLSLALGDSQPVLMAVIVVKTLVDLWAHYRAHRDSA